ncbi:hypothetical protein IFM51744_07190 [Aspergillus udagawae]|nr:hypothetical protein IFM51744_07190 [Aspergillus udagawae]GFG09846.1 hypothetical protein IFM5058_04626 [Aspergillus udagawae]
MDMRAGSVCVSLRPVLLHLSIKGDRFSRKDQDKVLKLFSPEPQAANNPTLLTYISLPFISISSAVSHLPITCGAEPPAKCRITTKNRSSAPTTPEDCHGRRQDSPHQGPLQGVRLWFNSEEYYVIVDVPRLVGDAIAQEGCRASNVSKAWNQAWAPHTTDADDDTGDCLPDGNIYYIYGSGEHCIRAIRDMAPELNHV